MTPSSTAVATPVRISEDATSSTNLSAAFLLGEVPASALGEPDWGPNGKVVYERTYSRPLFTSDGQRQRWTIGDTEGRTHEVWAETCRRVVLGNTGLSIETLQKNEAVRLFEAMFTFAIVPAGRHLWADGTGSPFTRNCWSAPMGERTSGHFRFLGSRLFEGGGVGANYSNDMLADSTPVNSRVNVFITAKADHKDIEAIVAAAGDAWADSNKVAALMRHGSATTRFINVPDSREGWVEQWTTLVDTACSEGNDTTFIFNVSDVRPFGAELKTYGGTASGPAPLVSSLIAFGDVLGVAHGRRLNSMEVMDLDHEIAASVVAGGTRRSSRLACKSWADEDIADFTFCKSDPSKHWSTNISVEIDDDFERAIHNESDPMHEHATKVLRLVAEGMARNGEPGFINSSRLSEGENTRIRTTNPCGEIALETEGSEYGEACNIGSVNLDRVGTNTAFGVEMFELLSRFLYRATLMPYPGKDANHIEDRNRRIGAGFMGLQEWVLHHNVRLTDAPNSVELTAKLRLFRDTVRRSADWLADDLATPRSIKVTTVAPNGSISKLPGAAPGIHPVLARYAEQRIRFGTADPKLEEMRAAGYPIEPCVYAANTMVVTIPTRDFIMNKGFDEALIEQADEVSLDAFLTIQKWVSQTYVGGSDGNAVSATASIPEGMDIEDVADILKRHIFELKGTTVFPSASRPQQPVTAITKAEYEELVEFCEAMSASFVDDCSTGACPVR